jgi:hypothetical protein
MFKEEKKKKTDGQTAFFKTVQPWKYVQNLCMFKVLSPFPGGVIKNP